MATARQPIDMDKAKKTAEQVFTLLGGAVISAMIYLGDRLGLYQALQGAESLTSIGAMVGTPEYMAPELAEKEASPASDVYALGVLLYQMLCGRVPFKAPTPIGVYLKHIRDIPEPPSNFNPAIPVEVEHVIIRALEKDPCRRFQSAQALYLAYAQAMAMASERLYALSMVTTQTICAPLENACLTVVPQKRRTLYGRFFFFLLLTPVLLVTLPAVPHASFGWQCLIPLCLQKHGVDP